MHKYRYRAIPRIDKANIYAEGKRAFTEGQHRAYNPYSASNLALAAIWWNGWDTAEEERQSKGATRPGSSKKPLRKARS